MAFSKIRLKIRPLEIIDIFIEVRSRARRDERAGGFLDRARYCSVGELNGFVRLIATDHLRKTKREFRMSLLPLVSNRNIMLMACLLATSACTPAQFSATSSGSTAPGTQSTQPIKPDVPPAPQAKLSETFFQNSSAGKVDILFVIDNSYSMQSLQAKVASRFGSVVSSLADIDYHIGLTTTDLDSKNYDVDGKLQNWTGLGSPILSPFSLNLDNIFANSMVRSETLACTTLTFDCPSGNEQPLKATIRAIEQKDAANAGFFRDSAPLAVIVLSNEDELSDGVTATTAQDTGAVLTPTPVNSVISAVTAAFGSSKKFMYNGIIVRPGDSACLAQQRQVSVDNGSYYGAHVTDLAELTGGSTYSICDADYAQSLKNISNRVRDLLTSFDLKKVPANGTVEVTLTPSASIKFHVVGKRLTFDSPPAVGTKIDIRYN